MIKHTHTETTAINFAKLEERLLQINDPKWLTYLTFKGFREGPNLIVATGGSKAVAYFLKIYLESKGDLCEVIEPRDYFYKENIKQFRNLIIVSNSGKSNGMMEILKHYDNNFYGERYLINSEYIMQKEDYYLCGNSLLPKLNNVNWSNGYIDKEKSFISIIPTLAPMLMILDLNVLREKQESELSKEDLIKINNKIKELFKKSKERINNLGFNFKNTNLIQVLSGYDTICSSTILESNMIETGTSSIVVHDKGSFCHGRSNLIFQNPESPIFYLAHQMKGLDNEILPILTQEYPNIFLLHTFDEDTNIFWKEYYLALQMYYLSKKIADDKGIDLTMPEYNPKVIKKLYRYKGEM